jgi:two-component system sensor histidine kinase CreC
VTLRLRIATGVVGVVAAALLLMAWLVLGDVRPHVFGATEDSLSETAVVLAALVETSGGVEGDGAGLVPLRATVDAALRRPLGARIYDVLKGTVDLRVYVTDARGVVVYDSTGADLGRDYASWRDVNRALRGEYGARATRRDPSDHYSSIFYVAVPLRRDGRVTGVLAVGKQARDVKHVIADLQRTIALAGLAALAAALAGGLALSTWVAGPVQRLGDYARAVAAGERPSRPALGTGEMESLGRAFESMRDALDGRRDVEGYVRSLTHETKTPLSAIRASAELLDEGLPPEEARRFLTSIRSEVERLQQLVDRMLELSALEARRSLEAPVPIDLGDVVAEVAASAAPLARQKGVRLEVGATDAPALLGDRLLVRQALMNLVHNAIRWTPAQGEVRIDVEREPGHVAVHVADTGAGVPDYALPRVFERFYSVPVGGESKGNGLGLAFVREIATLHGGTATLANRPPGGALATLRLALPAAR